MSNTPNANTPRHARRFIKMFHDGTDREITLTDVQEYISAAYGAWMVRHQPDDNFGDTAAVWSLLCDGLISALRERGITNMDDDCV